MNTEALEDISKIIAGQSPKSKFYNNDGEGVPFFQGVTDFGDDYPKITTWCTKPKKMAQKGDILFSVRAPVGPTNIAPVDCCIGRGLTAIRPNGEVDRNYLRYYLNKIEKRIADQGRGSTFNAITQKHLKALEVPVPPIKEQEKVSRRLNFAKRLIDIDQKTQGLYDELIQGIFLDMFGDPVTNPKGLTKVEFGDLVKMQGGYAFKSDNFISDAGNGIKVVKIANVHYIDLDWSEVQYLPASYLEEHEKYSLEEGDILLALTRPIINSLDAVKAVVVQEEDLPALLNQRVARIRIDSDKVTEDYITSFIYTQHFKREIERYASTSLQPNVSMKEVKKIKVLVPSLERQKKFSAIRQRIIEERLALEKSEEKSKELFSSLMQRAFDHE